MALERADEARIIELLQVVGAPDLAACSQLDGSWDPSQCPESGFHFPEDSEMDPLRTLQIDMMARRKGTRCIAGIYRTQCSVARGGV